MPGRWYLIAVVLSLLEATVYSILVFRFIFVRL
jgi:hypothetical protein